MTRALSLTVRIAVLVALIAASVWSIYWPSLQEATKRRETAITEVATGPVEVDRVQWTLESLKVYTRLADEDGKEADLTVPAGASIVVAMMDIKPLEGLRMDNNGFNCETQLVDDQDNVWKEESSVYGLALPSSCSDDDHPFVQGRSAKVMKVFVIPATALPHLLGVITPVTGKTYPDKRVLISA